jgi:DEAD/DEAH box helicase domain-containing protein
MRAQLLQGETFTPTIYLYDNQPGGIGLAERIFEVLPDLLARGLETLEACACRSGCPSCVGPVNEVGRQAKPISLAILKRLVARR